VKKFKSFDAIWHLFGRSLKHAIDALLSQKWQQEQSRRKLMEKIPKPLHARVEALVDKVKRYEKKLDGLLLDGLESVGFAGSPTTADRLTLVDISEGRFGPGNGSLVFNMARVGVPGKRGWKDVEEEEWNEFLTVEMEDRRYYVTADRHHSDANGAPPEGYLWNLYARATPWLAEVVGAKLEAMGDEGRKLLEKVVVELADEFSEVLGVDTIGIAVHREKAGDLHVHLIFSESREKEVESDLAVRKFEALVSGVARQRMRDGDSRGFKELRKVVKAELEAQGANREIQYEFQRRNFTHPIACLGPAFVGKMALYLASGKDPALAAQGDRPAWESRSFRSVVVEALARGEDLSAKKIDVWAVERLRLKLEGLLSAKEKEKAAELAKGCVSRYRKTGSEIPSVEMLIAGEVSALNEGLPEKLRADLKKRSDELDAREKVVAERERGVDQGLPAWVIALLDRVPKRMRKKKARETLEGLVDVSDLIKDVRTRVSNQMAKLDAKPGGWKAVVMDLAEMLGVRVPKEKTMEGPQM